MEFEGKLIFIAEPKSGVSKAGKEWKSVEILVEDHGEYPHKALFKIFGADKVDNFIGYHKVGDEIKVSFDLNASEWNGKWFNSLDAWKVELIANAQIAAQPNQPMSAMDNAAQAYFDARPQPSKNISIPNDGGHVNVTDDLPF